MFNWIREHKVPALFISLLLIVALVYGVTRGVGYLSAQRQAFIDEIAPGAIDGYREYGILPSLTIAQAILESNWGKSHIENNLFGMKAGQGWKGKVVYRKTKEYTGGKWITVTAAFRAYDSFADSVKDHSRLLASLSRYRAVLTAADYKEAAMRVWQGGYATDPNYPAKLVKIIEAYGLDKYDQQAKEALKPKYKYFADVPDGAWFADAINRLHEQGIVLGRSDGLCHPHEPITRAEAMALIDRVINQKESD